jgi:hypothetical protein
MFFLNVFSQSKYVLSALTGLLLSGSVYAGTAGRVNFIVGEATAISPDNTTRTLFKGDLINSGDKLETAANGRMQIRFTDGSFLALKPNTTFNIEKYSFSKDTPEQGSVLFNFVRGGFRTISGAIGKVNRLNYRMNTPVATIGIRGTDYTVIFINGKLFVTVTHGKVNVENDLGNADVNEGESYVTSKEIVPSLCHGTNQLNNLKIPQPCTPVVLPLETEEGLNLSSQKIDKPTLETFASYNDFTEAMLKYAELEAEANQSDDDDTISTTPLTEIPVIQNTPLNNSRQLLIANALDNKEMRDSSVINDFLQLTTITNLLDTMDQKEILKETVPNQSINNFVIKNINRKRLENQLSVDLNALFTSFFNSTAKNFFGENSEIFGVDFGIPDISVVYGIGVDRKYAINIDLFPAKQNKDKLIGLGVLQPSLLSMDTNNNNVLRGFSFKQAVLHDNDGIASHKNSGSLVIGNGSAQQSTVIFTDELTPISVNVSLGEGVKTNTNKTSLLDIKVTTPKLAIKVGDIYVSNSDSSAANIDKDGNNLLGAAEIFSTGQDGGKAIKIMDSFDIVLGAAKISAKLEHIRNTPIRTIEDIYVIPTLNILADAFIQDGVSINHIGLRDVSGSIKGGGIMINSLKLTDHNSSDLTAKLAVNIEQPKRGDKYGGILLSLKQLGHATTGADIAISDLRVGSDSAPDIGDIQMMGVNLNGSSVLLRGH